MRILQALFVVVAALSGSACNRAAVVEAPTPAHTPDVTSPASGAARYAIDAARSRIDILVFRGGPMARLGHNHVMSVRSLEADVWIHAEVARSSMTMQFPVAEMVVDDADARSMLGPDFPPQVPEKDRLGTRTNMLKPEVLDAERYPLVRMRSVSVEGQLPQLDITMAVTLKDVTRDVVVPARVSLDGEAVHATGEFVLKQTDFGIKPFSVAMGAVQVQDELKVRFDLHGRRVTSP